MCCVETVLFGSVCYNASQGADKALPQVTSMLPSPD